MRSIHVTSGLVELASVASFTLGHQTAVNPLDFSTLK